MFHCQFLNVINLVHPTDAYLAKQFTVRLKPGDFVQLPGSELASRVVRFRRLSQYNVIFPRHRLAPLTTLTADLALRHLTNSTLIGTRQNISDVLSNINEDVW